MLDCFHIQDNVELRAAFGEHRRRAMIAILH
jgi:hypothetical protein